MFGLWYDNVPYFYVLLRQLYDSRVLELEAALKDAEARRGEEVSSLEIELDGARQAQAALLGELEESLTATSAQYEATLKASAGRGRGRVL